MSGHIANAVETEFCELMQRQADALWVEDLFLFRRVRGERFVHLGGLGRGIGWAGIVELDLADNEMAAQAYRENAIQRRTYDSVGHVVGPYHARSAVAIPVNNDILVVAGSFSNEVELNAHDDVWRSLAERAMEVVTFVSPAKRLADELEILHAVQAIATLDANCEVEDVLRAIISIAAESLSCELGLAWLNDGTVAGNERGQALLEHIEAHALLAQLLSIVPPPIESGHCQQDARKRELPAPLDDIASSWFILRLPDPSPGWMLVVHASDAARGFTNLCQELARKLPQAASGVLATAAMRRTLRADAKRAWAQAEHDALSDVGNRTAWNRSITDAQLQVDHGQSAAVVIVDVDGLKAANDEYGHDVGDQVIAATAAVLSAQVRESDTVARLGGDEFALLLPGFGAAQADQIIARIRDALRAHPRIEEKIRLWASIGACAAGPGDSLREAIICADRAMYEEKTSRQPCACVEIN